MRSFRLAVLLLLSYAGNGQPVFQLAPPVLEYNTIFLSAPVKLEMLFNQPGASIHYTLNGMEPSVHDPVYPGTITIDKRTIVKARAMGDGFLPSETVQAEFVTPGKQIREIVYTPPHDSYAKSKTDILQDNIGGFPKYGNGDWLGYDIDTVEITIELEKEDTVRSVLLDLLEDEDSWIFLPGQILLYYYDGSRRSWIQAGRRSFSNEKPGPKQAVLTGMTLTQEARTGRLRLVLLPVRNIPGWHTGKGKHGWLFIDEIKIY